MGILSDRISVTCRDCAKSRESEMGEIPLLVDTIQSVIPIAWQHEEQHWNANIEICNCIHTIWICCFHFSPNGEWQNFNCFHWGALHTCFSSVWSCIIARNKERENNQISIYCYNLPNHTGHGEIMCLIWTSFFSRFDWNSLSASIKWSLKLKKK